MTSPTGRNEHSTTTSGSSRPPARNKSSSGLSTHSNATATSSSTVVSHQHQSNKPRRNKSAASLHHHHAHGHHNVTFVHHGHQSAGQQRRSSHGQHSQQHHQQHQHKRSNSSTTTTATTPSSGPKKSHSDFGMTAITSPQNRRSVSDEAPSAQPHRPASTRHDSSQRTVTTTTTTSEGSSNNYIGRPIEEKENPLELYHVPDSVAVNDPDTSKEGADKAQDSTNRLSPLKRDKAGLATVPSSYVTDSSGWESANDSPMPPKKALPTLNDQGVSGLGQVMQVGERTDPRTDAAKAREASRDNLEQADGATTAPSSRDGSPTSKAGLLPASSKQPGSSTGTNASRTSKRSKAIFEFHGGETPPSPEMLRRAPSLQPVPQGEPMQLDHHASEHRKDEPGKDERDSTKDLQTGPAPSDPTREPVTTISPKQAPVVRSPLPVESPKLETGEENIAQVDVPASVPPDHSRKTPLVPQDRDREREREREHRPRNAQRKSSEGSLLSVASMRSIAARMTPGVGGSTVSRRTPSGSAPSVDRRTFARGEVSDGRLHHAPERRSTAPASHSRAESSASARSLMPFTEDRQESSGSRSRESRPSPSRARSGGDADAIRRVRGQQQQQNTMTRSNSVAELQRIAAQSAAQQPPKRSNSGYFSTLRGIAGGFTSLATGGGATAGTSGPATSPGLSRGATTTRPALQSSLSGSRRSATGPSGGVGGYPANVSVPPQFVPVVSKFVEPNENILSVSPAANLQRAQSSAGLQQQQQHQLGMSQYSHAMSRTEQKALLARDAPLASSSSSSVPSRGGAATLSRSPPHTSDHSSHRSSDTKPSLSRHSDGSSTSRPLPSSNTPAGATTTTTTSTTSSHALALPLPPPPAPSSSASAQQMAEGMAKWALGLVREAERIDRAYRAVQRTRDPIAESLARVFEAADERERRRNAHGQQQQQSQSQQARDDVGGGAMSGSRRSSHSTPTLGRSGHNTPRTVGAVG